MTTNKVICNKCGCAMILRIRKSDNARFWGCSNFPNCKNTVPFESISVAANPEEVKKEFKPSIYQHGVS